MNYKILVNKDNLLHESFIPDNLVLTDSEYKKNIYLDNTTYNNFKKMQKAAEKTGINIDIMSGYRNYKYQEKIYNKLLNEKGFNYVFRKLAKPGASEHQTGLAIDFCIYKNNNCIIENDIKELEETKWIHNNCHRFGFIVRYPEGKEEITKYDYEPWHLRYIGELAKILFEKKITLEEYYNRKK